MKAYVSHSQLAARIGIAPNTLATRIRQRSVDPDGVLLRPSQPDVLLFDLERVAVLRTALATQKPVESKTKA